MVEIKSQIKFIHIIFQNHVYVTPEVHHVSIKRICFWLESSGISFPYLESIPTRTLFLTNGGTLDNGILFGENATNLYTTFY